MKEDGKEFGKDLSLEQIWLQSQLHADVNVINGYVFNGMMFERIIGEVDLDIFKEIIDSDSEKTNLLKEWLVKAGHTGNWLLKTFKKRAASHDGKDIWDSITCSLLKDITTIHKYNVQEVLIEMLSIRKDIWINNPSRVHFLFRIAIYDKLEDLQSFILKNADVDINSTLNIEIEDDFSKQKRMFPKYMDIFNGKHIATLVRGDIKSRNMLIEMGADIFVGKEGSRLWDDMLENEFDLPFLREMAATTMLSKSETPAEDVWSALDTAKTTGEKRNMLSIASKHGIWKLKSKKEKTKGKTTLMYLIEKGYLNNKTIAKMVPAKAWMERDESGTTPFEYLYKKWIQTGGGSKIDIEGLKIDISAEKYASLIWYGINYQTEASYKMIDAGITDLLLVTPPEVLKTGKDEDKDRFWGELLKNDGAIDILFKGVISTNGLSLVRVRTSEKDGVLTASRHREDFSIWRKSLQTAKMKDGRRWIESSKKIADITVLLYLMENILLTEKEFNSLEGVGHANSVAENWSNEMSKVLTDLYGVGGSISSVLKEKDKICIKHKKKISEVTKKGIISTWDTMFLRKSRVENFDDNVFSLIHNLDTLLNHWKTFEEKIRLSLAVDNLKEDRKESPHLYL